jgi:hypothetical protein
MEIEGEMVLVRWGEPVILRCPQIGISRQSCKIFLVDIGLLGQDLSFRGIRTIFLLGKGSSIQ